MFPIPWNFPLRKKNGNLVNIGDAIDEGTELPEHGEGDAGKVLSVDENGDLEWSDEVNSEIQTLTKELEDEAATRSAMGAKNLLPNIASSGSYASNGTVTKNANGSLTINGTFDAVTTINIDYLNGLSNAVFDVTDLVSTDIAVTFLDTAVSGITLQVGYFNSTGTRISLGDASTKANITFPADAVKSSTYVRIASGTYDNVTVYPMFRLATDADADYQPYAMTNRELTENYIGSGAVQTAPLNSTNAETTSGGGVLYYIRDGICTVSINNIRAKTTGNGVEIATGLPKSKFFVGALSVTSSYAVDPPKNTFFIASGGNTLKGNISNTATVNYATFSYPIDN